MVSVTPSAEDQPMPVTAKLSKLFYERLGEQVTNELVDWFNAVDATYRGDLRELNELNFARFDAKLEQRVAELRASLEGKLDTKLDTAVAHHAFAQLEARMERGFAQAQTNLEKGLKEQTRFMFLAWSALLIPIIGLWFRG
jgi:hypothetical protein